MDIILKSAIILVIAFLAPDQGVETKLSDEETRVVNKVSLLLENIPNDKDLEFLESLLKSNNITSRYLATVALYKQNQAKYEPMIVDNFSVHDYVDRSKGKYNYVGREELEKSVIAVGEMNSKIGDERVKLLILFLHYRDQNKWVMTEKAGKLSLARFFRSAFLSSVFRDKVQDILELANRIDQETQKADLAKPTGNRE